MYNDIAHNPLIGRIQNGTLPGDRNLCASCRNAIIRKGSATGFDEVRCGALMNSPRVPEKLAQCSMFIEKGKLSLGEMQDIAWVIEAKGKIIGFITPEELQRRRERSGMCPPSAPPVGF